MTAEPVEVPAWATDPAIHADAVAQAIPYTESSLVPDGAERAWSARVQAAVDGMDVTDPTGLDAWMQAHAESTEPHMQEAALVAAYETEVRDSITALEASWQASMDAAELHVGDDTLDDHTDEL